MLFSATLNTDVQNLATLALQKPIRVTANAPNKVVKTLHQEFIKVGSDDERGASLLALVRRKLEESTEENKEEDLTIIFFSRKKDAHWMATIFGLANIGCTELHGNLSQTQRIEGVTRFQKGHVKFLLATDLASRGLDLYGVGTVINYEVPNESAKYIHRVGRTARMGNSGSSITLYTDEEYSQVKKLGKLCSAEMKAEITKRTLAANIVESASEDIQKWNDDVKAIMDEETMEREIRLADIQAKKADNMVKHKDEIYNKPQKLWHQSEKEKHDVQEQEKQWKEEQKKKVKSQINKNPLPGESEKETRARIRREKKEAFGKIELKEKRVHHDAHMRALGRKGKVKLGKGNEGGNVLKKVKKKKKNKNKENGGGGGAPAPAPSTDKRSKKDKKNKKGGKKGGKKGKRR